MKDGTFGYHITGKPNLNLLDLEETVLNIHWRLARVTIQNLHYKDIIGRYDRMHTFYYLDPPYYGIKGYRLNFESPDFDALAAALEGLKGSFLMSLNDHPEVRRIFAKFQINRVSLRYSCMRPAADRAKERGEVLIRNY